MEDDDNSNSSDRFHEDCDQKRIVQQRFNISRMGKELFWYDLQHFPDSLLIEILARLPVKSIFRFKSVCKHWQTLISRPFFSRFYRSILNSNAVLPFRIMDRLAYVPNFKDFVNSFPPGIHTWSEFSLLFLSSPLDQRQYDKFKVINTSNGLILCGSCSPTTSVYYICDPLTRKWITITIPARHGFDAHGFFGEGLITRVNEDHMLTDYTLVRAKILNYRRNYLNLDMFSSETNEWINYKLPACAFPIDFHDRRRPIHCYGAIHWPVTDCEYGRDLGLVAFDPYKDPKSVRLIPLPNDRYQQRGTYGLYGECQGTLRYFQVASDPSQLDFEVACCDPTKLYFLTIWTMKDYEKGEWSCEFKVRRSDVHSTNLELSNSLVDEQLFFPLSFHPLNPNVVYLIGMHPHCIVAYDVLNRRLDVASKPIDNSKIISSCSVIPCVLPSWPVLV